MDSPFNINTINATGANNILGSRKATGDNNQFLDLLTQQLRNQTPFEPESLTEDYELGLAIASQGGTCRFVRARGDDDLLIATRAYFPTRLGHIVRQKTRWVHGIALQGWDRTGWAGAAGSWRLAEGWMRARDRRGPLTALVLLLGYTLFALTLLIEGAVAAGWAEPVPLSPLLLVLLSVNLAFFVWRAASRCSQTRTRANRCIRSAGSNRPFGCLLGRSQRWNTRPDSALAPLRPNST